MDFSIIKTQIINSRRTFRAPFKVSSMCFSPFNDLIALGSKSGDVMLRRTTWKMIWKTNIGMVPAVGTECKSDSPVTAMHFSPDGRFIAAATNKGLVHILDVECGKVRFSIKASDDSITKLQWDRVRDKSFANTDNQRRASAETRYLEAVEGALELANAIPDISREELGFVYQRLDEDGSAFKHDETQKDNLERTIIPDGVFYESFQYTILLATIDSFVPKIVVLVAGVFPFMEIDVESVIKEFKQDCIVGYDSAHYNSAFRGISFVVTTMGPHLDCKHNLQEPPVIDPNRPGDAIQTLMFTVKLNLEKSIWEVALRFLRLHFAHNLYSISLDTTKRNWTSQVEALHLLFDTKTKVVKIGDVLLEMLLSGSTDQAGEAFLERGLGTDGLEAIVNFSSKHLPEVGRLARGQLTSAARNLCFQLCEFEGAMSRYRKNIAMEEEEEDSLLYAEELSENEPAFPNDWIKSLAEKIAILDTKTRLLGSNCSIMMQELNHLTKWISLTKPFAKTMKVSSLMKVKRMEIAKVVRYVVENFIPDAETAKEAEKRLFRLEDLIKERKEKEKNEEFDELKYLDNLEEVAQEERKKMVDTYKVKFKFDALSDENDAVALKLEPEPEVDPSVPMEPLLEAAENQPPIDLDRVGSFFEDQLSEKALAVLPKCDEQLDPILKRISGAFLNSEDVRKIGIKKSLSDLASLLCSPQKVNCDKAGNLKKVEVLFVHEICSEPKHQGYSDIKISDVTPGIFQDHEFNNIIGMGRAIQVSMIQKNTLNSIVIVPKRDVTVQFETSITEHIAAMNRQYKFEHTVDVQGTAENQPPQEAMETDQNELRIDVDVDPLQPDYDTLTEYHQIHPLRHGELVVLGKFKARQDGTGILTRMMRSVSSYPHAAVQQKDVFAVNCPNDGRSEVSIETVIIHPTTELAAFLHDDGSKITLGDLKPETSNFAESEALKQGPKKTFREYQQRREIYRGGNTAALSVNDVQYDVLVQEAMDSGRDLDIGEDDDESDE